MRTLTKLFVLALLILGVKPLFAVDGQILISQSSVLAAGGFPYRITVPGSYKLGGNLAAPLNAAAIVIASSNVTLDLNGFSVACSFNVAAAFEAACITDSNVAQTALTIKNGSIIANASAATFSFGNYVLGAFLQKSTASTIDSVHFSGTSTNYNIGGLASGQYFIINNTTFSGTSSPSTSCPSVLTNNINATLSSGASGTGCVGTNNINFVALP